MKKLFVASLMAIAVFSSCEKNDPGSARSFQTSEPGDDILPEVNLPHSTVIIANNTDNDEALIEKVYTGMIEDIGGKFPIRRGLSTRMISTNLGENTFSVNLRKTRAGSSISIIDSDGILHSRSVAGGEHEILTFENVVVKENRPVFLNFSANLNVSD